MTKDKLAIAAALSGLLLASCGSGEAVSAENAVAPAETNAIGNAGPADPGSPNGAAEPGDESFPPPDAVSHPNGFLPNAADLPSSSAPEPAADSPPGSKAPATEDEHIRNGQSGR